MLNFVKLDSGRYVTIDLGAFGESGFGGDQFLPASNSNIWDSLASNFPNSPTGFEVRPGSEGPQAVLTWSAPLNPIHRLMIRRKLHEYPRHPGDGVLVLDDSETASTRTSYVDNIVDRTMDLLVEFVDEHMRETLDRSTILQHKSLFDILDTENDGSLGLPNQSRESIFDALFDKVESKYDINISVEDRSSIVTFFDLYTYLEPYDLLPSSDPGNCRWWYYRIFVKPEPSKVEDQFGGLGKQTLNVPAGVGFVHQSTIDVQEFDTVTVIVDVIQGGLTHLPLYTSPTSESINALSTPIGVDMANGNPQAGDQRIHTITDNSFKFLGIVPRGEVGGATVDVYFIVNRNTHWQTNSYLSKPCLVYKTGRHIDIMWRQGHLPEFLINLDDSSSRVDQKSLDLASSAVGRVNLWEPPTPRGSFYRFLKLLSLELDRDHAYLEAMHKYDVDLFNAPVGLLQHIAFELGWQVDTSSDLLDVRAELSRVAGFYKTKGRPHLVQSVSGQELGLNPRIQEGPGLVLRAADPTLFGDN